MKRTKLPLNKNSIKFFLYLYIPLNICLDTKAQQAADYSSSKEIKTVQLKSDNYNAYLFAYFTGKGDNQESIRFALSNDGYNFRALNNNQPVLNSKEIRRKRSSYFAFTRWKNLLHGSNRYGCCHRLRV